MEHFITEILIDKVRHLNNITIELSNAEKKHLMLTGKNGSGKTSVLNGIKSYLRAIENNKLLNLLNNDKDKENCLNTIKHIENDTNMPMEEKIKSIKSWKDTLKYYETVGCQYGEGLRLKLNSNDIIEKYQEGKFILAYFDAHRMTKVLLPNGVEKINLLKTYGIEERPSVSFVKFLVDLKTQQAFAQNEGDNYVVEKIQDWFDNFENSLKTLIDDESLKLKFDYRNYNFDILQNNREPYGFDTLSAGYSSVLNIIMDLILRMENTRTEVYDVEGVVLIDEVETHLHIELQKKIMGFLTSFFPKIQFIITTHSPFVLSSVDNAVIYDLENKIKVDDLSNYSYEGIVEGYFNVDKYSKEIKEKIEEYEKLVNKIQLTDDERARRAELKIELKEISSDLAVELKLKFEEIEMKRKNLNDKNK